MKIEDILGDKMKRILNNWTYYWICFTVMEYIYVFLVYFQF